MVLFNWKKVYQEAQGSTVKCVEIIDMITYKKVPFNSYDPLYRYRNKNFSGDSFLLQPEILLENGFRYSPREIAIYVGVASRRKLADYLAFGEKTLSIDHAPQVNKLIEDNRLLYMEGSKIHFVYEEAQRRTKNGNFV
jgi:hypothetical protein